MVIRLDVVFRGIQLVRLLNMNKPKVSLVGTDGNAFSILAKCFKSAKKHGWDSVEWNAFEAKAKSGDYQFLLKTIAENFDIE